MTSPAFSARPLAVQMYTLRRLTIDQATLLNRIANAGFAGVETFGPLAPPAPFFKEQLDRNGLRVVSAHVALETLSAQLPEVVTYHQTLGNQTLVVPWLHPDSRPADAAGWRKLGEDIGALARRCQDYGMRLLYHNHDFEMVQIEGRRALDWLFEGADLVAPGLLGAEMDLAWVMRGGVDPVVMLQRYAGRCPRAHAKDVAPPDADPAQQGHADVGDGLIDWESVLPAARAAGVEWLVVEHDEPADPLRTIQRGAAFLAGRW